MKAKVYVLSIIMGLVLSSCGPEAESSSSSLTESSTSSLSSSEESSIESSSSYESSSSLGTSRARTSRNPFSIPSSTSSSSSRRSSSKSEPLYAKPIIYFYPEEEMDLSVTVTKDYLLTTTYPEYNGGWNIHLEEDGTITIPGSTREYYALYYEANSAQLCAFEEGFYVTSEDAASFLEEKMDFMGFTDRETDEFIMYWLPILENNGQSLVYFEQTEELNVNFPLAFSQDPDTLIRVMMHVQAVDGPISITEQQLTHYDRNGFVVTEWGGSQY